MKYFLIVFAFTGIYAFAELPQNVPDNKVRDNLEYLDQKVSNTAFTSKTIAQLNAITPSREGLAFYCSDCVPKKVVISVGTTKGAWAACDGGTFE